MSISRDTVAATTNTKTKKTKHPYPERPRFWANQVHRALIQSEAVATLGRDVCWLITFIAAREDMLHYKQVPKWWTPQIMDDAGFSNKKKFLKTRQAAIDAGWLILNGGGTGVEGEYFTAIPGAKSHQQIPEADDSRCEIAPAYPPESDYCGAESHQQLEVRCEIAPCIAPESEPANAPLPNPSTLIPQKQGASLSRPSGKTFSQEDMDTAHWMFEIVRELQPEHTVPNFDKWAKDIRLMRECDHWTDEEIRELFQAADGDDFWRQNIRCPAKLRKQWDQLDLRFRKDKAGKGHSADFQRVRAVIKRTWSPDVKNHRDVEAAVDNPDLYQAAKLTGLCVIADSRAADKELQATFGRHLASVRGNRKATA